MYRGNLEKDKDTEPQLVAVKKLKTNALNSCLQDFEREISIMKVLLLLYLYYLLILHYF